MGPINTPQAMNSRSKATTIKSVKMFFVCVYILQNTHVFYEQLNLGDITIIMTILVFCADLIIACLFVCFLFLTGPKYLFTKICKLPWNKCVLCQYVPNSVGLQGFHTSIFQIFANIVLEKVYNIYEQRFLKTTFHIFLLCSYIIFIRSRYNKTILQNKIFEVILHGTVRVLILSIVDILNVPQSIQI